MAERFVYLNGDYVPERDARRSRLDRQKRQRTPTKGPYRSVRASFSV